MSADVPNRRLSGRKRLAPISFWENQIVARASDGSFADGTPNIIKAGKSETSMRCANVMNALMHDDDDDDDFVAPPSAPQPPKLPATQLMAGTVRTAADGTRWRVVEARRYRAQGGAKAEWERVDETASSRRRKAAPVVEAPESPLTQRVADNTAPGLELDAADDDWVPPTTKLEAPLTPLDAPTP